MGDKFESKYMLEDSAVRHRDKRVSRGMTALIGIWAPFLWVLAAVVGVGNASSSNPVPAAFLPLVIGGMIALGLMFGVLALTFAVLRTVVTNTHVVVKYGLWGPTIALDSITSCKVADYAWTQFGGFGIRRGMGGKWAYVPGPGQVVELEYEESGVTKIVQIGADDAQALALEINRARQAGGRIATTSEGARIDIAEDDAVALAEAEAAAIAEAKGHTDKTA